MPHIKLDIAPATATHCETSTGRCRFLQLYCKLYGKGLWDGEIEAYRRLPACLAAEKALQETEERAEAWWWAAMEHVWEDITTEYSLQEWRKKNPSFLRQHTAVLVKPDVS